MSTPRITPELASFLESGLALHVATRDKDLWPETCIAEGKEIEGKHFSGGVELNLPWGKIRTANITPDQETGIGSWDREQFIDRFKVYSLEGAIRDVAPGELNTLMPWSLYTGMTRQDLGAIYDYLRTVPAVRNHVERFEEGAVAQK